MLTLGPLSIVVPWALAALAALPVIWWLLRLTPPLPSVIPFPAVRLLLKLKTEEESSAHTPPWLLFLRLALAALVILAAAHPLLNADAGLTGKGPLITIIDDGWAAAANWPERRDLLANLADQAERESRPMVVITTASSGSVDAEEGLRLLSATDAGQLFQALQPKPWPTERERALEPLLAEGALANARPGDVVWLSDGLEETGTKETSLKKTSAKKTFADLLAPLQRLGGVTVVSDPLPRLPKVLRPPVTDGGVLKLSVERASTAGQATIRIRALGEDGRLLGRHDLVIPAGEIGVEAALEMPTELLNRLHRLEIEGEGTAGGVVLTDERWRRRPVGLVPGSSGTGNQPLLSDLYYLERALKPFTEVRTGPINELLKRPLAVMVLADPGRIGKTDRQALDNWINDGGVAVRFAGPLLAKATGGDEATADSLLLPVRLRRGDRVIGGTMSWSKPAKLAAFGEQSLFHGLAVPTDVTVKRQVLAQPATDLADKTWARLDDGTPLVTAERRGKGWLVLAHITANAQWSNLPLSGLFVGMLRRLVGLSQGVVAKASGPPLEPISSLDGFARLGPPPANARAIAADAFDEATVSQAHPPGFYGTKAARRALNLSAGLGPLEIIGPLPGGVTESHYGTSTEMDFRPGLLALAMLLALVDFTASLGLRGLLPAALIIRAVLIGLLLVPAGNSLAQENNKEEAFALGNSLETRLAYVLTGDRQIDETSHAGLQGLNVLLKRRTAAELGPPQGVDPARDELSFFPLLYWPVTAGTRIDSERAKENLNKFLRNGGTIFFDTQSAGGDADLSALRNLARVLDIPPLVPAPPDHVLTRAFYLIKNFPGRWAGSTLWVERAGARVNDGVSSVIAGGNDWAAAWALDDAQRPIYPVVPGGERQREMAFRFGINLVMYTLTGNYKADQVHIPAIIKRLGK